jgi:hypothetical protein
MRGQVGLPGTRADLNLIDAQIDLLREGRMLSAPSRNAVISAARTRLCVVAGSVMVRSKSAWAIPGTKLRPIAASAAIKEYCGLSCMIIPVFNVLITIAGIAENEKY